MQVISGKVLHGEKIGRRLGFPTANLDRRMYARQKLNIRFGVWAGYAFTPDGKKWQAGIVIGPKDKRNLPKLEAHLVGFSGKLYGQIIRLELRTFMRAYKKFSNLEDLKLQISADLKKITKIL